MVLSSVQLADTIPKDPSTSSLDLPGASFSGIEPRRTRKRITPGQLAQLEELYRESSHPTREQRDALGRRIQMETKSVTIWFQNKRQTDRKVALHKAAHSHAVQATNHGEKGKSKNECVSKAGMSVILKRASSYSSSISSTSSTSSKSKRPTLDRVASRSEIRFTDKITSTKNGTILKRQDQIAQIILPSSCSYHASPPVSPVSPIQASGALWSHMLSSPIAPSSPPPVELVAYSRTRKTRTLDWACTVARLSGKEDDLPERHSTCTLKPAFDISKQDAAMSEREYEDAIATTEDEDELVTPQASQDTLLSWPHNHVTITEKAGDDCAEYQRRSAHLLKLNQVNPWQEDEMHAALALCGLRG